MICSPKLIRNQISVSLSWKFSSVSLTLSVFLYKTQSVFNVMSSFLETEISVSRFIMPHPRNIDLFSNDGMISWSGETDDCKEIILPRNYDLFPNFLRESYLLERGNRCFGETGSLAASEFYTPVSQI